MMIIKFEVFLVVLWVHVSFGIVSGNGAESGGPLKWYVPVWWDFCREVQMRKNGVTIQVWS